MRLRMPVLASAAIVCVSATVPSIAAAAPHPVKALTIHATPRQVIAGEPVLIFGRLEGRHSANQPVVLWHRINPQARFTVIGRARTDSSGRYEFTRAEGIINSNRNWFVRGPVFTHSKTIHERVAAEVTMAPSASESTTRRPLTFSGQVTPAHAGSRVALQVQRGDANDWRTVAIGKVGAGSSYSIRHAWRTAGPRTVRVVFSGDRRNRPAASDPAPIVIDQTQAPFFTINTSDAIAPNGSPAPRRRPPGAWRSWGATASGTSPRPRRSPPARRSASRGRSATPAPSGSGPACSAARSTSAAPRRRFRCQ